MNGNSVDNGDLDAIVGRMDASVLDRYDHWILQRLIETTDGVAKAFIEFEMHPYPHLTYEFFWNDYCDWYVEASKTKLRDPASRETALAVQDFVLRQVLMLLHPLVPFITEELWNALGFLEHGTEFMEQSRLPGSAELRAALAARKIGVDEQAVRQIEAVKETIVRLRALKSEYNVSNRRDVAFSYSADPEQADIISANLETIQSLAGIGTVTLVETAPAGQPASVTALGTWYVDLASAIDVAAERERLGKELAKLDKAIAASQARLANDKFVNSAPAGVVQGARDQLTANLNKQAELQRLLASL
ncbi:MAG: class I tRNA ligase family protein, partial [Verrucomicrobia bacterium]|nr:class I tRNA ligase family protein [Verrucomicrobiota bacterium]